MTQLLTITVPLPPSVNNAFRNVPGRGRVKTKAYKDWEVEATILAKLDARARGHVAGPYALHVKAQRPDNRRRDLSNLLKVLEDFIVRMGMVEDDSRCERIEMEWDKSPPQKGATVTAWVISTKDTKGIQG